MLKFRHILCICALAASSFALQAQTTPLWLRSSSISPDGEKIAFSYQGDIFVVSSKGGQAVQLTSNSAYDSEPLWSADGKKIVFSSYRELSKDIFVTSVNGGEPKRLTYYSGSETPLAVLQDGTILFSSNYGGDGVYDGFPGDGELYKVSIDGGKSSLVTPLTISNISVNADGTVLYEDYKGYEDNLRKHHTSSVTRDVWLCESNGFGISADSKFTKLSTFKGENRNPVFASDGVHYYYLSEQSGTFNVWKASIREPGKAQQITAFSVHPVRNLSISADNTLCFSFNGELYTVRDGQQPAKLAVTLSNDSQSREKIERSLRSGASDIAISPNGKEVAIVAHGDVFVTSIDYTSTRRITNTPGRERGISFSEDGRELYYGAERDGCWGIYKTSLTEKNDKYFTYSVKMKEELVTEKGVTCSQPAVSPDGKKLAFLRDRTEIVVKDLKSGKEKSVLDKNANYSYQDGDQSFEWSPDSNYLLTGYQANGGWNNADVALIDVETGTVTDLTQSGYSDGGFRWAMKGKAMTWTSDKNGYRSHGSWGAEDDIYAMFFDAKTYYEFTRNAEDDELDKLLKTEKEVKKEEKQEAKDSVKAEKNKVEKLVLDLDGREDRIVRLTKGSGRLGDHYLANDGSKLYYVQRLESSSDLCMLDIKKGNIKVITKNVNGSFYPDRDGKYFFVVGGPGITRIDVASGSSKSLSFNAEYDYYPAAEREYIFYHTWKQVKEKFYDADIHGIDWDGFRDNYAQFLPYIKNNFDFRDLLSEMLGELNGSHTGARYYYRGGQNTAHFGVIFDTQYEGKGLKIKEVLPGSCLTLVDPEIKAGDVIEAIDGVEIEAGQSIWDPLVNKAGKDLLLKINKGGKESAEIRVKSTYTDQTQLYTRWVRQREAMVKKLSGGRVGYVHVEGMDSDSFREVYSKALGKYRTCEALIVDTRHNGGGWLHDDLATFLSGKAYIDFVPRGQYIGTEPYSKWLKPSCVLVCEDNYSDASGFPYVYRELGIGKLIGSPVPGTMTAVWWETQIDNTIVFGIPEVTSISRRDGSVLENQEIEPDILVYNDPASSLRGEDKQLEAAVAEMLKTIDAAKK